MVEAIICLSLLGLLFVRRKDMLFVEAIKWLLLLGLLLVRRKDTLLIELIICLSLLSLLLVRRKILRLYWLTPSLLSTVNVFYNSQASQSRDAKSCVSQARVRNMSRRLYACHWCVCCTGDARFCVSTGLAPSFIYQGHAFITYRRLFPEPCHHIFGIGNIDHRRRHNTLNG